VHIIVKAVVSASAPVGDLQHPHPAPAVAESGRKIDIVVVVQNEALCLPKVAITKVHVCGVVLVQSCRLSECKIEGSIPPFELISHCWCGHCQNQHSGKTDEHLSNWHQLSPVMLFMVLVWNSSCESHVSCRLFAAPTPFPGLTSQRAQFQ